MCNLNDEQRNAVKGVIETLLASRIPFTGLAVTNALVTAGHRMPHREVSAFARETFNSGGMPGWASTQVEPGTGPVLYFPVPPRSEAGLAAARIRRSLRSDWR